jgi:hypothetical protein
MPRRFFSPATLLVCCFGISGFAADLRPPAVPLVTHDPYFSIWSMADHLNDDQTRHWTGTVNSLNSLIRIDGKLFRLMGREGRSATAMPQTRLEVLPTHTYYEFEGGGVHVALTFFTPALPDNFDVLSRTATYLTWNVRSVDGARHQTELYFDAGSDISVNVPQQPVTWERYRVRDLEVLRTGSQDQPVLQKSGDDLRIDWGHLYLVAPPDSHPAEAATLQREAFLNFQKSGSVPDSDELATFQPYAQSQPVLALSWNLGVVGTEAVARHLVLAYDDQFSIMYFERRLRPWWRRNGAGAEDMLRAALDSYESLDAQSVRFDQSLMKDLQTVGGEEYARICALAYRQTFAAHKLTADLDDKPLFFSKENFSNGSIDTVDVTYPSSPFFLLFAPRLLEGQLRPIMDYASLPRWKFPFAPHDLGRYPLANGQQYGGGEKTEEDQMPVEESGNMLLMIAALAQVDGNANFAQSYWPLITKWAEFLKKEGLDPGNQLCTDDFAGHLAHNANLSIKAILALAAYGQMAGTLGHNDVKDSYTKLARDYAARWVEMDRAGDHFGLTFNNPDSWSQKYNLVWDQLLNLHVFPDEVRIKELAYYMKHSNKFGLPLDNRADYTKIDWLTWSASLATSKDEFATLFHPAFTFTNESTSRVPLSDWYDTKTGKQVGFQARSVVGGMFIRMLTDRAMWAKYSQAAKAARQ